MLHWPLPVVPSTMNTSPWPSPFIFHAISPIALSKVESCLSYTALTMPWCYCMTGCPAHYMTRDYAWFSIGSLVSSTKKILKNKINVGYINLYYFFSCLSNFWPALDSTLIKLLHVFFFSFSAVSSELIKIFDFLRQTVPYAVHSLPKWSHWQSDTVTEPGSLNPFQDILIENEVSMLHSCFSYFLSIYNSKRKSWK